LRTTRILVQTAAIAILEMDDAQTRIENFTDFDCRDRRGYSAKRSGFCRPGPDRLLIAESRQRLLRDIASVRRSAFSGDFDELDLAFDTDFGVCRLPDIYVGLSSAP
jgi:hypothetical protein